VYAQLTSLGYTVQVQEWSRNGYNDQNLIVRKVGEIHPEEELYFVAHMDGENSPAADDNATGTVDLLELARVISNRNYEKTIVLLFSSGEEQDVQGVKYYVEHLSPEQLAAIKYVINLDMLGYDHNNDGVMELFNGSQPPDFVQLLAGIITDYRLGLTPEIYEDCG
jgi:Zn-dependent M28 family amino/carboxypeptidase